MSWACGRHQLTRQQTTGLCLFVWSSVRALFSVHINRIPVQGTSPLPMKGSQGSSNARSMHSSVLRTKVLSHFALGPCLQTLGFVVDS